MIVINMAHIPLYHVELLQCRAQGCTCVTDVLCVAQHVLVVWLVIVVCVCACA